MCMQFDNECTFAWRIVSWIFTTLFLLHYNAGYLTNTSYHIYLVLAEFKFIIHVLYALMESRLCRLYMYLFLSTVRPAARSGARSRGVVRRRYCGSWGLWLVPQLVSALLQQLQFLLLSLVFQSGSVVRSAASQFTYDTIWNTFEFRTL